MVNIPYEEEQLSDGLVYAKYHPHIHAFTFTNMTKATVDAGYKVVTALDKDYAEKKIHIQYMYILDDAQYTPYLLKKLKQSVDIMPATLQQSVAVVADSFLTRVFQAIVIPKVVQFVMQSTKFFLTEEEAFVWLEERRKSMSD